MKIIIHSFFFLQYLAIKIITNTFFENKQKNQYISFIVTHFKCNYIVLFVFLIRDLNMC